VKNSNVEAWDGLGRGPSMSWCWPFGWPHSGLSSYFSDSIPGF